MSSTISNAEQGHIVEMPMLNINIWTNKTMCDKEIKHVHLNSHGGRKTTTSLRQNMQRTFIAFGSYHGLHAKHVRTCQYHMPTKQCGLLRCRCQRPQRCPCQRCRCQRSEMLISMIRFALAGSQWSAMLISMIRDDLPISTIRVGDFNDQECWTQWF